MWVTSPGRWPVSRIILSAVLRISPAESNAVQNLGISLSDNTRSRLLVSFRSTPWQGLTSTPPNSSRIAHANIADAEASVWFATTGAVMRAIVDLTSEREMSAARSLAHRGSRCLRTSASACRQDLFLRCA